MLPLPSRNSKPASDVVVELIEEKKRQGVAMVAIVHDDEIRHLIADRIVDVTLLLFNQFDDDRAIGCIERGGRLVQQ